jgi:transmembrane 9 superfamily protein 2/4
MMRLRYLLPTALLLLLSSSNAAAAANKKGPPPKKAPPQPKMTRAEKKAANKELAQKMANLKAAGQDTVSMTKEAAELRAYELRKKKTKGLIRKREASLAQVLFPGASPEEYNYSEPVPAFVEVVESKKTQLPFKYYDLPTCPMPSEKIQKRFRQRKNLGSRLMGHKQTMAPYQFPVKVDKGCTPLCLVEVGGKKLRWMRKLVERQYRVHLSLDQLPVLMRSQELNYAVRGYPIGFKAPPSFTGLKEDEYYIYNHLRFTVFYREEPEEFEGVRIVGFDVHPVSIEHKLDGKVKSGEMFEGGASPSVQTCDPDGDGPVNEAGSYLALRSGQSGEDMKILYSYEVAWEQSDIPWADRWDVYLVGSPDDEVHYFAIVNSLMIVIFLTGAVATILIRTLKRDIAGYNEMQTLEEAQEETGWKLVHGDVFRPPQSHPLLLCVLVGSGAQIGSATFLTLLASMLRMLNPLKKGQSLTAIVVLYVLCGGVGGYVSARLYKFCDAKSWKRATIATAVAFPGTIVATFMVLNMFLTVVGSATAVSFFTLILVFLLWGCVATPLVFVGSYFGYRAEKVEVPTKTNQIARFIPDLPTYASPPFSMFLTALLPFGSVCIELFFIMSALWLHQLYYIMGFLMAVLIILVVTIAQVSMVQCYLQLCCEDHRWWWKSFLNAATTGLYLFGYSLWFLGTKMDLVGVLPVVVYLTYMSMISLSVGLLCGTVGYLSCFWFTKKIYGAVKAD